MKGKLFRLRLITNMHMGSGESNFNFIDNQVQRDPITNYPNMHSSGIKGALRDFFSSEKEKEYVVNIFGQENESSEVSQGKLSFIEGKLLALPVRSNKRSYFMGTTIDLIDEYINFKKLFVKDPKLDDMLKKIKETFVFRNKKDKAYVLADNISDITIESLSSEEIKFENGLKDELEAMLGLKDIVIFNENIFKEDIVKRLPVIPRNCLENGESKNLWYEEVVPRETIFYTGIIQSQILADKEFEEFVKILEENLVQIGANATIGYGYTKFNEVK